MARRCTIKSKISKTFQSPSFRWFLCCAFFTALGRNGYAVACAWILVASGKGSADVATFIALISLTELATSPVAGWISDRCDRRAVFIAADVIRVATAATLMSTDLRWVIWCSAVVFAACDRVALTASHAMIPSVGRDLLPGTSNSISFFVMQVGGLVAAGLVGMLLHACSAASAFAAITGAFFLSACSMLLVNKGQATLHSCGYGESVRFCVNAPLLQLGAVFSLLYGGGVLVSILGAEFVLDELSGTALNFGQLESAWSAGAIVGAVLLIVLAGKSKRPAFLAMILVLTAISFATVKLSAIPWVFASFAALGALHNLGRVVIEVNLQASVPHFALGRAKGLFHCAGVSVGLLLFGVVSLYPDRFAPSTFFLGYAGFVLTGTAALSAMKSCLIR